MPRPEMCWEQHHWVEAEQVGRTGGQEELKGLYAAMVKTVILAELEGPAPLAPGA